MRTHLAVLLLYGARGEPTWYEYHEALQRQHPDKLLSPDIGAPYYGPGIINDDHRQAVGPHTAELTWEGVGHAQLAFLLQRGLQPWHTLLDLGCGSLRAGVHLVRHQEPRHYYGIDINPHLLDAGYRLELAPLGLAHKLPREQLLASSDYEATHWGLRLFDFVLAASLWTHLPLSELRRCLGNLAPAMRSGGRLYATFFLCPEPVGGPTMPADTPAELLPCAQSELQQAHGGTTYSHRDPWHYRLAAIQALTREFRGLSVHYVGGWGQGVQKMLEFTFDAPATGEGSSGGDGVLGVVRCVHPTCFAKQLSRRPSSLRYVALPNSTRRVGMEGGQPG